jgi:NAD(P)H-dependent FMN reductase
MIEVIAGTNRPGSNTRKLAELILGLYKEQGAEAQLLSLEEMPQEIFDSKSYAEKPASFAPLSDRILASTGLHVVVPEYNGSFPGVMKYFIDMLKFPESFEHRCVAFTGQAAGIWGAFRSVEQLQMIFGYRNAFIFPERVWIPKINEQWDNRGVSFKDESMLPRLKKQVGGFLEFVAHNTGSSD